MRSTGRSETRSSDKSLVSEDKGSSVHRGDPDLSSSPWEERARIVRHPTDPRSFVTTLLGFGTTLNIVLLPFD